MRPVKGRNREKGEVALENDGAFPVVQSVLTVIPPIRVI